MKLGQWLISAGCVILFGTAIYHQASYTSMARAIEAKYSKDRILELYMNQIYLGNGAYGVETASQRYFGKPVKDVNVAEAATLAALPRSPTRYDPRRFPDRAVGRRTPLARSWIGRGRSR